MNVKENDMSNQNNNVKINLIKNTLDRYEENIKDKSITLKNSNVILKCNENILNNNLMSNTIDNIFNFYLIKNSISNTIESYQKISNDKSISNKLTNNFHIVNNVIQNNLNLYVIDNDKNIRLYRR
jgi:hypothetical protein